VVDRRYLAHPSPAVRMLHLEDGVRRPVDVIREKGYLLVQAREGVA
jgi:hypothetical protein